MNDCEVSQQHQDKVQQRLFSDFNKKQSLYLALAVNGERVNDCGQTF